MSQSIGRNDPCPCGSGKKYKKCCARKEQNVVRERVRTQRIYEQFDDTVVELGRWLSLDHPRAIETIGAVIFRALYSEDEAEAMPDRIEAHEQSDALTWNGLDAALAYWAPTAVKDPTFADLDAASPALREQIGAGDVARLDAEQQHCATDLLASAMRLWKVEQFRPNETLVLRDLATDAEVRYPFPTASFTEGDVFATRVVRRVSGRSENAAEAHCMMGFLPIAQEHRDAAVAAVRAYDEQVQAAPAEEPAARRTLFLELWRAWLAPFAAPSAASEASGVSGASETSDGEAVV